MDKDNTIKVNMEEVDAAQPKKVTIMVNLGELLAEIIAAVAMVKIFKIIAGAGN